MIVSMRDWPKAPRVCLLERIAWSRPRPWRATGYCSARYRSPQDVPADGAGSHASPWSARSSMCQPMRHAVEPVADRLVEFGLPRAEDLGHGGHAPLHFRLRAHDFGKPGFSRLCLGASVALSSSAARRFLPATIMTASRMKSTSTPPAPSRSAGLTETPETVKTGMKRAEVSVCMGGH